MVTIIMASSSFDVVWGNRDLIQATEATGTVDEGSEPRITTISSTSLESEGLQQKFAPLCQSFDDYYFPSAIADTSQYAGGGEPAPCSRCTRLPRGAWARAGSYVECY